MAASAWMGDLDANRIEGGGMKRTGVTLILALMATAMAMAADNTESRVPWEISGNLSEACTCSVPCTCNFGQGPSPHHYCWSLFSLDIQKGHYGDLKLDGLKVAGEHGKKSDVWYIDDHASKEQFAALKVMLKHMDGTRKKIAYYESAQITQEITDAGQKLKVGDHGGFEADFIMGMDDKTPVKVENNTSWNIEPALKAKTTSLDYEDKHGNDFHRKATNSNEGHFDWSDTTEHYF
jgi:hypothetical protein